MKTKQFGEVNSLGELNQKIIESKYDVGEKRLRSEGTGGISTRQWSQTATCKKCGDKIGGITADSARGWYGGDQLSEKLKLHEELHEEVDRLEK